MSPRESEAARWSRQVPLIGEEGQRLLCSAAVSPPFVDGPQATWARLYLERAGVTVRPGAPDPDASERSDLGVEVVGQDPPLPELLGALAAADLIVDLLGRRP